ncbi:MAG: Methyltransferase domain [Chlamydiales bacterium]|jgi:cyclopropane fatty-acyl-phospholipid synthase-like methyltransferase|nr:Methyltransferase domain [Chlamydiales bacterium]
MQKNADIEARPATYDSSVFETSDLFQAQQIILTASSSTAMEERWEKETPEVASWIAESLNLGPHSYVLDFGCGVGRVAKELIGRYGCSVIGVDLSAEMRKLAVDYVNSDKFFVCSPEIFMKLLASGARVDHAYSIWVLQHIFEPNSDILKIKTAIRNQGKFFVLNSLYRWIPTTDSSWAQDSIDVAALLKEQFVLEKEIPLINTAVEPRIASESYCHIYKVNK